jgi:hypothetical protein
MRGIATLTILCVLAACGPQVYEPLEGDRPLPETNKEPELVAKLDEIERHAEGRVVRVILTVADGKDGITRPIDAVTAALLEAGAYSVDPIEGTAFLVVEATPEALRAAIRTGRIADVALDELSAPDL